MSRYFAGGGALYTTAFLIEDEDRSPLYRAPAAWNYHNRIGGFQQSNAKPYFELWRATCFSSDNAPYMGHDWDTLDYWDAFEPWQTGGRGSGGKQATYYVTGNVTDSTGSPANGVTVKLYRTSDDLYVSSGVSDASGNYGCYTPYTGVSHYAVAYLAGSPDKTGTSLNTLTPTAT